MTHRSSAASGRAALMSGRGQRDHVLRGRRRARAADESLVEEGIILPVEIEGLKVTRYIPTDEESILEKPMRCCAARRQLRGPLDPLWDRGPSASCRVRLPAGRSTSPSEAPVRLLRPADPVRRSVRRPHRAAARPQVGSARDRRHLVEAGFEPMESPGFLAAFGEALEAYRAFVGAERITWPRTRARTG